MALDELRRFDIMLKVPAIIATAVICFALGAGAGVGVMALLNPDWVKPKEAGNPSPQDMSAQYPGGQGVMGGGPGGGPPGGGRPGGGPGGFGAPNPKIQLVVLVNKLEALTGKSITVKLNEDKQKKLAEQLQGLEDKEELSEDDAKKRLDAILEIVKDDKATLEAAGYRWPGERPASGGFGGGPGGGPSQTPPNPFKVGDNNKHLKSLQEEVSKGKTE
jgi:hypothetical protein